MVPSPLVVLAILVGWGDPALGEGKGWLTGFVHGGGSYPSGPEGHWGALVAGEGVTPRLLHPYSLPSLLRLHP